MPEKDGSEDKKSTKSVVNKKQKQFMNQEEQLDLSSVAESFGGKIVGEPVELDEDAGVVSIPLLTIGALAAAGIIGTDSYQKMRGKKGILPDLSGVVKGVGDTYNKVKNVFATADTRQQRNKKRYYDKNVVRNQPFSWGTFRKSDNNKNNKNKNKNRFKTLRDTSIAGTVGTLIGTQTKGRGGGFRLGGLPGTAHNVGRRTNPQ